MFDGENEWIRGFDKGCSKLSIGAVCVVWFAAGRKSGGHATVAPGSTFKAYLGAPCQTSKLRQPFFYKPVHGDETATGKGGHSSGGALGVKHGRHGMLHHAIAAGSIVCRFFRVRGVGRTSASSSSDCNTGYHWRITPVERRVHTWLTPAHDGVQKNCMQWDTHHTAGRGTQPRWYAQMEGDAIAMQKGG